MPPYTPMEPYLQHYCQRHIQEYVSWNRNRHEPGKSTTGMMLLSLLRVQDNNILPKWYEKTTGLCFDCPEDGDLHTISTHLQPFLFMGGGTRLDIIAHILMGCHAYFAWGHHLYFTNKTTSPLCKPLGNKLQECIAASSMQALIANPPLSLLKSTGSKTVYLI